MKELIEKIQKRYDLDQQNNPKAYKASDIPVSYEAITNEWLTAILCQGSSSAEVIGFQLDLPDDGSTNRRRIFIDYNESGQKSGLPKSVFCKASHDLKNRFLLATSGAAETEIYFYNHLRAQFDIVAPRAYFADLDRDSYASIIVLEDLGGQVEFCDHKTLVTHQQAESQVKLLAKFHSTFYEHRNLDTHAKALGTWPEYFGRCREAFLLDEYCQKGFQQAKDVVPSELFGRQSEIWPATLNSVERHKSLPKTLIHSDVHLKNWYVSEKGTGEMGLSDWQNITVGNWSRDFAYAISTALTVENRRAWEKDLLKLYLQEFKRLEGTTVAFDKAWDIYRAELFGALAWWTITLLPQPDMPDMQPSETSMEFIKRISQAIQDLEALNLF